MAIRATPEERLHGDEVLLTMLGGADDPQEGPMWQAAL
jgi:hypothetical protein